MQLLEQAIREKGEIKGQGILKVDSFLNHQIDIRLYQAMGQAFHERFATDGVTKILTVEASGIGIACMTAQYFDVPVVFAKKTESLNMDQDVLEAKVYSYTKAKEYRIRINPKYLLPSDRVLIIDDFLANGQAVNGLLEIIHQSGASLAGVGIVIEKGFQPGGARLRQQGIKLESLAIIQSMNQGQIQFA